jgi:predicted PurR-regulated permease PerM
VSSTQDTDPDHPAAGDLEPEDTQPGNTQLGDTQPGPGRGGGNGAADGSDLSGVAAGVAATGTADARTSAAEVGAAVAAGPPDHVGSGRFGLPGLPVNRAHPFYIGFAGAAGAMTAIWLLGLLGQLSSVLTLIVVALFLALGLEPVVAGLERRGLPRGLAVGLVFVGVIAVFAGVVSAVVPAVVTQVGELTKAAPGLVQEFQNSTLVRSLDRRYGLISSITDQIQQRLKNGETVLQLFGGVYGAGAAVVSGAFSTFTVLVLTLYFTASLRTMTEAAYRLVPASRRPRVTLLANEIIRRIGGYIAGQVAVASINGMFTFVGLVSLQLPYALVLAITVALFGLIPLVGATIGAVLIVLVGLFHSWQYAVIIAVYYLVYQQVENYVIAPRIMARTVSVPGAVAVVAALAGGTLLGALGALIAIPVAAGILLIMQEVLIPRQAKH